MLCKVPSRTRCDMYRTGSIIDPRPVDHRATTHRTGLSCSAMVVNTAQTKLQLPWLGFFLTRVRERYQKKINKHQEKNCLVTGPLVLSSSLWTLGPLVPCSSGPLPAGPLVLWSLGPLVPWSSSPVVLWSPGPWVLWSFGSPATSLYPSAAAAAFETCCPYLFALRGGRCALPRTPSRFFNPPRQLQVKPKETLKKRRPKRSLKSKEPPKKRSSKPSPKKP